VATLSLTAPASGAPAQPARPGVAAVIEVSGLLDRVLVDFVTQQIADAERDGVVALVLQLNSSGAVVADDRLDELVDRIRTAEVPVDVWVGPSGSQASDEATELVAAARTVGVAPGSHVELTRTLLGDRSLAGTKAAVGDRLDAEAAVELGVADNDEPVVGQFLLTLDGVEHKIVKDEDGTSHQELVTRARFAQLPITGQLMHTVASPPVAYLLFVIGLALIVFELFTAGVGVAGLVGAGALVLGSYGLAALPTNPVAIGLLLFAVFGYAIDVQTGVPRAWSVIGTLSFVAGSVLIYEDRSLSWVTLSIAILGITMAMVGGMPAMVRTRFSTPTIGREWMIGEVGRARSAVSPDGVVLVRDAPWRAHTSRVTPIEEGAAVRVVAIDGLVLEVEPVDGDAVT
jgi:membrane-bound serine protease (ClpP class)